MFTENANTMFNNAMFNSAKMRGMSKTEKEISQQMARLYLAAKELRGVVGKSALARFLDIAPQNLNNWENGRPISSEALLIAQEKVGCDAIWLRDGVGDMAHGGDGITGEEIAKLVELYSKCDPEGRKLTIEGLQDLLADQGRGSGARRLNKPK